MARDRMAGPIVLMVEDDEEFAADMKAVLDGIAVLQWVSNTAIAAAWLLRSLPDLLWLDLDLPAFFAPAARLEGAAFLRLVRERLAPELPVLVVSGRITPKLRQELLAQGVVACLEKPPDLAVLVEALKDRPPPSRVVPEVGAARDRFSSLPIPGNDHLENHGKEKP
jgi:CheY-like chemotaxis protein